MWHIFWKIISLTGLRLPIIIFVLKYLRCGINYTYIVENARFSCEKLAKMARKWKICEIPGKYPNFFELFIGNMLIIVWTIFRIGKYIIFIWKNGKNDKKTKILVIFSYFLWKFLRFSTFSWTYWWKYVS
jgi:hypothetical protein